MTQRAVAALSQKEQNWQAPDKGFEDEICGILKRDIHNKAYPMDYPYLRSFPIHQRAVWFGQ